MGTIRNVSNNSSAEVVQPVQRLLEAGERIGIPFACTEGNCGTCLVRVIAGQEGLSDYSDKEKDFGLAKDERLTCQMRILKGDVLIEV